MSNGWVKSLQCKSRAFEDVYHPIQKNKNLMHSASCRKSVQSIKDVVDSKKPRKPKSPPAKQPSSRHLLPTKPDSAFTPTNPSRTNPSTRPTRAPDPFFPALTDLPEGHPSRNVVQIIFHTSWSPKAFTGRIEMIFKVQNGSKTVSRFEEYREMVMARAGSGCPTEGSSWEENARCVADGNELMRFHCLGPTTGGGPYDAGGGGSCAWLFPGVKGSSICTFSGSGRAHESAGGGRGRRAMLVCRVIAGRVSKQLGIDSFLDGQVGFDSMSGENGEVIVFDSRAVLPCFLIVYKI
ncbi:C2H2-like zinc finger protein [Quillaja saponaria]|uniref:C2H2-like zinc finger protein n=1 Tax=Quillaja saponaria TaxID=32244 RepID=A0AAD7KSD1_QUISA|nr:C2H2-like zinc finger protein [Quillaja saponaria]